MMRGFFARFARGVSQTAGSPNAFLTALAIVIVWALLGPALGYSERWQLFINTGTTIVTFLMVFVIQSAQNHDQAALQLKLDELLKAIHGARTGFVNLEQLSDEQIEQIRSQMGAIAEEHRDEVDDAVNGRWSRASDEEHAYRDE